MKNKTFKMLLTAGPASLLGLIPAGSFAVDLVFDPTNFIQIVQQVEQDVQLVSQLADQIRNQKLMLQGRGFTQLPGILSEMTSIELTLTPAFYGSINPAIQLDQFYPSLPDNYINTADSQISADRTKWDARERAALDENRTVQNQIYRNLNQTAALLTVDLEKSNQAPGMTSVIQTGNEVVALLINQLQTLTTQEMTGARTAVEQEARAQAEEAYAQQQLQSVRAGWEHPATPVTHLTDPFSNAK